MANIMRSIRVPIIYFALFLLTGCQTTRYQTPLFSGDGHVQMIVEIPAGTNLKYEINPETDKLETERIDGTERRVAFLPYPGNYGFLPSTLMEKSKGGDGDALDVLLIAESMPQSTIVEIIPVAVLHLLDHGERDDKIIAIPVEKEQRIINCKNLNCLQNEYPNAIKILELWFTGYKEAGEMIFADWGDEKEAMKDINNWKK